jgi:hypothetical protein
MFKRGIDQVEIDSFEENFMRSAALAFFREPYCAFVNVSGVFEKTINEGFFADG